MSELNHIYKRENNYFIVDGENLSIYKLPNAMNEELDKRSKEELENNIKQTGLKKCETYEVKNKQEKKICNRLIITLSNYCNLECKYCYACGGAYQKDLAGNMSLDTLKNTIDGILKLYPDGINMIQFFGGEPLMNKSVLVDGIAYIDQYVKEKGVKRPHYTIVTNGTLIDDEMIELFNTYFDSVTISLDGEKTINDQSRVFRGSDRSVYDTVIHTIQKMNKTRKYFLCIEITVTPYHIKDYMEKGTISSLAPLKELQADSFEISPVFHKDKKEYQMQLLDMELVKSFFEEWVKESFDNASDLKGKYHLLGGILTAITKKEYCGNNCGAVVSDVAVDVNGDMYPCFMFIGFERYIIGNVNSLVKEEYDEKNLNLREYLSKANENEDCQKCWSRKLCANSYGHCIGSRLLFHGNVDKPISFACEIGKAVIERSIVELTKMIGEENG